MGLGLGRHVSDVFEGIMGPELHTYYRYPTAPEPVFTSDISVVQPKPPVARPALIAQIAKFTGTGIEYWAGLAAEELLAEVAREPADHVNTFVKIQTPIEKGVCLGCGSVRISRFTSMDYRRCLDCHWHEPHTIKEGQEAIF